MDSMSLVVGDRVVYPNQGLCKVTAIESKDIAGQKLRFVTLVREEDGAKVMVPEGKVLAIGVRKVSGAEDVNKVFGFLKSDSDKASLDWKARARTNTERMATGGLIGLAEVVKGLQVLSELRPLPPKERELYNDARHLLVSELAASLKIPACDAEDALDVVLFPVGKERPKRSAEEFKADDEFGEDGDLLGFEGDSGEEEPAEEKPEGEEGGEDSEKSDEGDGEAAEKPKKRGRPPKNPAAASASSEDSAPKKNLLSDVEMTAPAGTPLLEPVKRKRGRPPKPKPPPPENPPPPKKRGRPPKPKPPEAAIPAEPKKRGRPPKKK
ncbi:MAG: CarD family transcriptional regulator [Myxococcaceae bacterium]